MNAKVESLFLRILLAEFAGTFILLVSLKSSELLNYCFKYYQVLLELLE